MRDRTIVPTNLLDWPRVCNLLPELKFILQTLWAFKDLSCAGAGFVAIAPFGATLSLKPESVWTGLKNLAGEKLILLDEETSEIFILDWFRFHTFKTPVSKKMLDLALSKIQSTKIKAAVVEKSKGCLPTPTPTPSSSSSSKPTRGGGDNDLNPNPPQPPKNLVDIFLDQAGNPDSLNLEKKKLEKNICGATSDQAGLAGIAWREDWLGGKVRSEVGLAVELCKRAARGEITPTTLAIQQKNIVANLKKERELGRLEALNGNKYLLPDGLIAAVDHRIFVIDGLPCSEADSLTYLVDRVEAGVWPLIWPLICK